jgi:hypothetical protein
VQNAGEAVVHDFKPIELGDKPLFDEVFASDPPTTSELTFTNLFMWRLRYTPVWKIWDDCLLIVFYLTNKFAMGLPPTGTGNKSEALDLLVNTLAKISDEVQVSRASRDFVDKHGTTATTCTWPRTSSICQATGIMPRRIISTGL